MSAQWPNGSITFPFSGIASGFVVHPDHTIALYLDLSGVQSYLGWNPLNGFPSITARISGIESGYVKRIGDMVTGGLTVVGFLSGREIYQSGNRVIDSGVNIGLGTGIFASKVNNELRFKSLISGNGITLTSDANTITISSTVTGGSANAIANVGNGSGLYLDTIGATYRFKSLISGSNINFSVTSGDITINSTNAGTFGNFNQVFNEIPAGLINSSNVTYTLLNTPSPTNSLLLFKNGLLLSSTGDYSLVNKTITTVSPPISGSVLSADYTYASTTGIGLYTVGVTTPSTTTLNSMATWGNTTGTQLLTNSGITTDGSISITVGGNISGFTSGNQDIGSSSIPFKTVYSNQYATSLFSGAPGGAATALTINWNLGSVQKYNFNPGLSGNVYLTLSNPIPGSTYVINTIQNPSGSTNVYFPPTVKWMGSNSGTMTSSGNALDIFTLLYDGSVYYGNFAPNFK